MSIQDAIGIVLFAAFFATCIYFVRAQKPKKEGDASIIDKVGGWIKDKIKKDKK